MNDPPMQPLGPLFIDVGGTELLPEERGRLAHPLVGGVILFSRNYEDLNQLRSLVTSIKQLREPALLIGVDQEGGRVQRFRDGFTPLPAAGTYGTLYDANPDHGCAVARDAGCVMAVELRQVGIDLSFAPVLDLGGSDSRVIGDRAFHHDPNAVTELARAFIEGMHDGGMKATGKHFPGHGGVAEDSHTCVPCDHREWVDISTGDLMPYRSLRTQLHAVMTAHVQFPGVDEELPTYSRHWLETVLREQIGFSGVIFSDDLSMEGAKTRQEPAARVRGALHAGCDMALLCNHPESVDSVLEALESDTAEESTLRLTTLKGAAYNEQSYERALDVITTLL